MRPSYVPTRNATTRQKDNGSGRRAGGLRGSLGGGPPGGERGPLGNAAREDDSGPRDRQTSGACLLQFAGSRAGRQRPRTAQGGDGHVRFPAFGMCQILPSSRRGSPCRRQGSLCRGSDGAHLSPPLDPDPPGGNRCYPPRNRRHRHRPPNLASPGRCR